MKAVILAGGEGKRLRPITCTVPKPMVKLLNKPTLFYTLELLKKHGFKDVVLTLGYMGEVIKNAVQDAGNMGLNVTFSDPEKRLGTAGSVRHALNDTDEPVLVMSGDGITDLDISRVTEAHTNSKAMATVVLYSVREPSEYGIAVTDPEGYIRKFIEKPSESEVFSDRANTGIYVLSPQALEMIPEDNEFDFSKELFPKILSSGGKLYGYEMKGYWCDIGDTGELRRAQADMLDGRCSFDTCAKKVNGVFIEEGAIISPEARLVPPCYIGKGAEIGSRTLIDPYSVVCSGAKVMEGASLKRSVIMENATVRRFSELRGAIVCENADVDARCSLLEGSVIGAGSRLGKHVTVAQSILIWSDKVIEPGTKCSRDIVWGENRLPGTEGPCFTGYADRELTPELALRIASAFAKEVGAPADMGVGTDGSTVSVMIKQAAISGILSQGTDAVSADAVSRSAFGHMIRLSGLGGGIYVESDELERRVGLRIFDSTGTEADGALIRSIVKSLSSGDIKPATNREIGVIRSVGGTGMEYEASLLRLIDAEKVKEFGGKLIINAPVQTANTVARVMLRLGWTVDTVSELKRLIPTHNADAVSVLIDRDGMISCFAAGCGAVDRNRIFTVLAVNSGAKRVPVPAGLDMELREFIEGKGIATVTVPDDASSMRSKAAVEDSYVPSLLEPEAAAVTLCALLADGRLYKTLGELPEYERRETEINVSKCDFGRMLRSVIETEFDRVADMTDGVRLRYDSGWVTVRPGSNRAMRIVAGSRDAEYSKELCDVYAEKLRKLNREINRT